MSLLCVDGIVELQVVVVRVVRVVLVVRIAKRFVPQY